MILGGETLTEGNPEVPSTRELNSRIWTLAWPAVSRMFLQSVVGMVDIMMIGRLGAASIAAVSTGNRIVFILIAMLQALAVGSTALVAQYVGAKEKEKAEKVVWQTLYGATLLSIVLSVLGFFLSFFLVRGMLSLMEEIDPRVLAEGTIYLRVIFLSMIFGLPQICINALLQGLGDMKTPLYIMLVSNAFNVVGNYVLIFGIGPFPELGVLGAALATGGARVVGALFGFWVLYRGTAQFRLRRENITLRLDKDILGKILRIGIPASIEQLVRQSGMIIYTFLVGGLGTLAIAANAIVMNVQSLSSMPGFGFGLAATTLVGQSLGAKKFGLARAYGIQTTKMAVRLMSCLALILLIWPEAFIRLYTTDFEVVQAAIPSLRIVAAVQPVFGVVMVISGALRGAGDTKWVMFATMVGNWVFRVGLSFLMAFYFSWGLMGFWIAVAVDLIVRGILIAYRYQGGAWQRSVLDTPVRLGRQHVKKDQQKSTI